MVRRYALNTLNQHKTNIAARGFLIVIVISAVNKIVNALIMTIAD